MVGPRRRLDSALVIFSRSALDRRGASRGDTASRRTQEKDVSTRSQIAVYRSEQSANDDWLVNVYRHHDGYPDSEHGVFQTIGSRMRDFVRDRGIDDEYFCARLVQRVCDVAGGSECNTGAGIAWSFHGDIEFFYRINLDTMDMICYGGGPGGKEIRRVPIVGDTAF